MLAINVAILNLDSRSTRAVPTAAIPKPERSSDEKTKGLTEN